MQRIELLLTFDGWWPRNLSPATAGEQFNLQNPRNLSAFAREVIHLTVRALDTAIPGYDSLVILNLDKGTKYEHRRRILLAIRHGKLGNIRPARCSRIPWEWRGLHIDEFQLASCNGSAEADAR